ncbi:alginate export family protein [Nitrospira sp. Kam-Ns4a]
MRSIGQRKGWLAIRSILPTLGAAVLMAGLQVLVSSLVTPALAGYELPPGERITNLPPIPRNIPQKEAYEAYDPVIGRNFDLKNLWLRADLRVRPEARYGMCFGQGNPLSAAGNCNTLANARANSNGASSRTGSGNTFFVQQWVRLGIGYDLSPDVNFYMEMIYSQDWGTTANPATPGAGGGPALNNNCSTSTSANGGTGGCNLGVRAAYVLIRNLAGIQGLSMKAGRQYLILGNHSLFGHFDWANTGFSHDGILFAYSTKAFDTYFGWFREADVNTLLTSPNSAVGGVGNNIAGGKANNSANLFILYNQIKTVPGFLFEPYYILFTNFVNNQQTPNVAGAGSWTGGALPKANLQVRHTLGNRTEMRKGNWDIINETAYQFGRQASGLQGTTMDLHINAWATRNWIGYTVYEHKWKPRLAFGLDYASGDGNANCGTNNAAATSGQACGHSSNTFENFYPTNHIHMGYMDIMAWRNMFSPQVNLQFRPSERDHFEIWYANFNLANTKDNWYRANQLPYAWTKANNNQRHIGDEIDFTWTRMFADGRVALQGTWGHMFAGAYIRDNITPNAADQDWWYLSLWMNF